MAYTKEDVFWKKKLVISWMLSIFVFLIHISSFAGYSETNGIMAKINDIVEYFFTESFTRIAVPMFFILSSIAFFVNYDNSSYSKKIKSRIHTLFIPYLIWNTIWMIFEIICSYTFISSYFLGRQKFVLSIGNILKGIFFYKSNTPFWFVFDLLIFMLFAPIIDWITKKKYVGILTVVILTVLLDLGIGIPDSVFYSSSSIVYFLIGAIIGKHYFNHIKQKSNLKLRWISVIYAICYVALRNVYQIAEYETSATVEIISHVVCVFAVWNVFDFFIEKIKIRPMYKRSFAIYAIHVNVSAIITKILYLLLPKHEWVAIPNFMLTVVLTIAAINVFCVILERFAPTINSLLMGNRR